MTQIQPADRRKTAQPRFVHLAWAVALVGAVIALPLAAGAQEQPATNNQSGGQGGAVPEADHLSWSIQSLNAIGCDGFATNFTTNLVGYTGGPERFRTIVDAAGDRYMDEDAGTPCCGNGLYGWSLYTSSSGGPITAPFPLPPDTPITVDFGLIDGVGGPYVFLRRVVLSQCNGGTILSDDILVGGEITAIPTLSGIGIALLVLLLAAGAAWSIRRRRTA